MIGVAGKSVAKSVSFSDDQDTLLTEPACKSDKNSVKPSKSVVSNSNPGHQHSNSSRKHSTPQPSASASQQVESPQSMASPPPARNILWSSK